MCGLFRILKKKLMGRGRRTQGKKSGHLNTSPKKKDAAGETFRRWSERSLLVSQEHRLYSGGMRPRSSLEKRKINGGGRRNWGGGKEKGRGDIMGGTCV